MRKALFFVFLSSSLCFSQAAPTQAPTPHPDRKVSASPVLNPDESSPATAPAAELPPTAAVITIPGFCPDAPAGTAKNSPQCKTVVTKAAFEKLVDTLNPNLPPQARQKIATEYAKMLVFSDEAKKRGLEDTPRFKELLKFIRMQVAAQELFRSIQDKTKPTDEEVKKYYEENIPKKYEEISLKRIFIPRNSPNAKPTDPKPTDDELKAEGEKVRARLAAGEDFDKVQKEIYENRGYKTAAPPTSIPNWRRDSIPPSQAPLFDLKQGELSQVMVEPAGAYIYKVDEKKTIPLEMVKPEIETQLGGQRMRTEMDALSNSVKPELNEAYFRNFGGPIPPPGTVGPAGGPPHAMKTVPPAAAQRTPAPAASKPAAQKQ